MWQGVSCPHCGFAANYKEKFCRHCGYKFSTARLPFNQCDAGGNGTVMRKKGARSTGAAKPICSEIIRLLSDLLNN